MAWRPSTVFALPAVLLGLSVLAIANGLVPTAVQPTVDATADVETAPVSHAADAADDPAIWVHPTVPGDSVVIGTDKQGALEVYDLTGERIQQILGGRPNNVDLRKGFSLGGQSVDLVGASYADTDTFRFFTIDPSTRQLTDVTAGPELPSSTRGFCMYRSPVTGRTYAFGVGSDGRVVQVELFDLGGRVGSAIVRYWDVGSEAEGCVADDALKHFYVGEEEVAIWKYGAEPGDSTSERTRVDRARGGRLIDVEGLTIVEQRSNTGYLIASSQGDDSFVVYQREGTNDFVRKFKVGAGDRSDGCFETDGIDAVPANLGPSFPSGMFSCQDGRNTKPGSSGNQNFKFVRLEKVVELTPTDLAEASLSGGEERDAARPGEHEQRRLEARPVHRETRVERLRGLHRVTSPRIGRRTTRRRVSTSPFDTAA